MELYQLRTFLTVADEGHLTHAAEKLFTSQPAVSAQIKGLEDGAIRIGFFEGECTSPRREPRITPQTMKTSRFTRTLRSALCTFLTPAAWLLLAGPIEAATRTWDGGAISNDFWGDSDNWAANIAPVAGDALIFPAGIQGTDRSTRNNFGATIFLSLRFDDTDYSVNGDTVRLSGGIKSFGTHAG